MNFVELACLVAVFGSSSKRGCKADRIIESDAGVTGCDAPRDRADGKGCISTI